MAFPVTPFTSFFMPILVFFCGAGFSALAVEWVAFASPPGVEFQVLFTELSSFLRQNNLNSASLMLNILLALLLLGMLPMTPPILVRRWSHVLNYLCGGALTGFLFVMLVKTLLGFEDGAWLFIGVFTGIAVTAFAGFVRHPECD